MDFAILIATARHMIISKVEETSMIEGHVSIQPCRRGRMLVDRGGKSRVESKKRQKTLRRRKQNAPKSVRKPIEKLGGDEKERAVRGTKTQNTSLNYTE